MFGRESKDTDFMDELEAATSLKPATSATLMLFSIVALVCFGFIWMAVSKVEERTRGAGSVVPTQEIQVVQSLEGGLLEEILVKEGQSVKQGDILLRLSDVQFASQERGAEVQYLGLYVKRARLKSEASGEPFTPPMNVVKKTPDIAKNELALYESRQNELHNSYAILDDRIKKASADLAEVKAKITERRQNLKLLNQELKITRDMVAQRAVPKIEQIRLERELSSVNGDINAFQQKQKSLEAELEVTRKERLAQDDKFRSQALGELNKVETEISSLEQSLKSIGDRVFRTEIRAPVDGIVNKIALKTIGGVVEPAMKLVEIVPLDEELKIIARVSPEEVAFLRPGLPAKVKVTAYDAQKYGALKGELVRLASNSVTDSEGNVTFEIEVRTDKNYMGSEDNPLPITPGMVAEVEVITGKRTILEYMMKPILRARDRAFTER